MPISDRDTANRTVLDRDITDLTNRKQALDARQDDIRALADQGRLQELYPTAGNPVGAALADLDHLQDERIDDNMRFGENPENPGFGGRQFTSNDGIWYDPVATHSQYWDPHNPSRENIASIVTGHKARVH